MDLMQQAMRARAARIQLAREDVNTMCELVLRDERTGEPIEQAPIHCAWHDTADTHRRLIIWSHVESGKTSQIAVGRTLHMLGRDPSLRGAIVSNTYHQAEKIVGAVAAYIETSKELHAIFPELRPSEPWSRAQITVQRDIVARDPSLQACGVHGNILGARLDFLILDDILDFENTRSPKHRADLWDWYHSTLVGRLTRDAVVIVIGNAWHPDDVMHRLAAHPDWHGVSFPILFPDGSSSWPERWPLDRIEAKRGELGPLEFARQMMCRARDDSEARFKKEWLEEALEAGRGLRMVQSIDELWTLPGMQDFVPPQWMRDASPERQDRITATLDAIVGLPPLRVYTGVDLAVSRGSSSAETVLFTLAVRPDGKRQPLEILAGKWTGPEIVSKILSAHDRFGSIVIVENNAAQDFIVQFARERDSGVPVVPFTTGRQKLHPELGVEAIAAEFAAGKWVLPCGAKGETDRQLDLWMQEMLYYQPTVHTGDRLMASWFAREAARRGERGSPRSVVQARVLG